MSVALVLAIVLILAAELVNGWTDAPNAIATVVGTHSLSPGRALVLATVFNTLGVLSGTAVATTIGTGIVDAHVITLSTVTAAMTGIVIWSSLAARWGLPTSESHGLVAGLTGAGLAASGTDALVWFGWKRVLFGLVLSGVFGFVGGHGAIRLINFACRGVDRRKARGTFRWLQIGSSAFVAFGHGSNDGQKFMGAFTLALVLGGVLKTFAIPLWVTLTCAGVMALGTSLGGWRIMQTLGTKLTRLEAHQGFAAEMAAASTISAASALGIPLSTTHTIASSIVGVGVARGAHAVRWNVARNLLVAAILTFPICGAISFAVVIVTKVVSPLLLVALVVLAIVGAKRFRRKDSPVRRHEHELSTRLRSTLGVS